MKHQTFRTTPFPRLLSVILIAFGLLALLLPAQAADKSKKSPMLRIVCPPTLGKATEYTLASKDQKGNWSKRENLTLRPSYISDWIEVPQGELGICVLENEELVSKWSFNFEKGTKRALVVLLPGEKGDLDTAPVIDTGKLAFKQGETLVINSSTLPCTVTLGGEETVAKPGERLVLKPSTNEQDMYRMLVTYTTEDGKVVTCNDRYLSINKSARDLLLLVPDPNQVVQVLSLSDFGPFE